MELGKEIAKLRKNMKLTQVELSKKTKVGLRLIRYIEQGMKFFRYDKLDILLIFFNNIVSINILQLIIKQERKMYHSIFYKFDYKFF